MKKFIAFSIAVILNCLFLNVMSAQELPVSAGGEAFGEGGNASYSVGEVVYNLHEGSTGSELQGVQQPYEISVISDVKSENILFEIKAYPNPANEFLILKMNIELHAGVSYNLIDLNGVIIDDGPVNSNEIKISVDKLIPSTYLLKIYTKKKEYKTFKIIKY